MLRRVSLRAKLVAAVVLLVIAAETGFGVATAVLMRDHLLGELDRELAETVELLRVTGPQGILTTREADPPTAALPSDYLVYVYSPAQGFGIASYYDKEYTTQNLPRLPSDLDEALELGGDPVSVPAQDSSSRWRMIVTLLPTAGAQPGEPLREDQVIMLVVAQNMAGADAALNQLIWTEVLVGAAVLGLVVLLGATGVRRSLRPLLQMERTAQAITGGDLSRRVPEPEGARPRTELGRLARALNTMLEQIESAFAARARSEAAARDAEASARQAEARARQSEERMRQFVADASHELRTPLTSIRGFAELYRQGAASSPEETAALVGRIESEAARMGLLVQDLLLLARLDQQRPLEDEPVELAVVVSDSAEAAQVVEPDRPITVELPEGTPDLVVRGDDARLRQVVGNLLNNALTHTPAGTPVWVRLYAKDGLGVIEVADEGPGLAPEQAERVFERFYRVDAARGRPARRDGTGSMGGGTGLGLAIVAAITAAHGGSVELDTEPGRGATFRVRLPLADRELVTIDQGQQPRAERGDEGE